MVKIRKSDITLIREAEESGLLASMTMITNMGLTKQTKDLGLYFRQKLPKFSGSYDEEESEDVLFELNKLIKEENLDRRPLCFPTEGSNIYLLPVTENLQLQLLVVDEYLGGGDYNKYTDMSYFVTNESTTERDVDTLIKFVKQFENLNL